MTEEAMAEKHIVTSFDNDLEAVQAHLMRMGGLTEAGLSGAIKSLEKKDVDLAAQIKNDDAKIDDLEEMVKAEAARIIALRAPTAIDLRVVLATIAIANHLERSGDHAKNIAKRSVTLAAMPAMDEITSAIGRQAKIVLGMLSDGLTAFIQRDVGVAREIRQRDAEVDMIYNNVFRSLLTHMMEDPRNITTGMHLHFVAKNLERIGDHATGIAEQTMYLVSGEMPDDDRPRKDTTPMDASEI